MTCDCLNLQSPSFANDRFQMFEMFENVPKIQQRKNEEAWEWQKHGSHGKICKKI